MSFYAPHNKSSIISLDLYDIAGIIVSVLIHIALLKLFLAEPSRYELPQELLAVSIVPEEAILSFNATKEPPKQIVSPTEADDERLREKQTNLLSDKDKNVEKEQIKRGDLPPQGVSSIKDSIKELPIQQKPPQSAAQEVSKESSKNVTPFQNRSRTSNNSKSSGTSALRKEKIDRPVMEEKILKESIEGRTQSNEVYSKKTSLKTLNLDPETLLKKYATTGEKNSPQPNRGTFSEERRSASNARPFSRPVQSGAAFYGGSSALGGTPDLLPNLPDGDITMLNTKAEQFATFVRRVAIQVFTNIRRYGWDSLSAGDIQRIGGYTTFRAVLSKQGSLKYIQILEQSGSSSYDTVIEASVKNGAKDSNPPPKAVNKDGNIVFVFRSKSWSMPYVSPRSGIPSERRWLVLETVLE
jgi:hypothetical protein